MKKHCDLIAYRRRLTVTVKENEGQSRHFMCIFMR